MRHFKTTSILAGGACLAGALLLARAQADPFRLAGPAGDDVDGLLAQADDPPPGPRGRRPPREDEPAKTVEGVVASFHENPRGDVDGLTLEDGQEVHFSARDGERVSDAVKRGDKVSVSGRLHTTPEGDKHLHAATIKLNDSGKELEVDSPPPPPRGDGERGPERGPGRDRGPGRGPEGDRGPRPPRGPDDGPDARRGPPHEQMLAEIRAIRRLVEPDAKETRDDVDEPPHGPPHERVLHELHELRKLLEKKSAS